MLAKEPYVTLQQLEKVHRELSNELCQLLELLNDKLRYGFTKARKQGAISREYAELREARLIIYCLKRPDHAETTRVHRDDLAWALSLIQKTCQAEGNAVCLAIGERAAEILGIDMVQEHSLPVDLNRKIANELQMMLGADAAPVALAAAA